MSTHPAISQNEILHCAVCPQREASTAEMARMPPHVLWFYRRGQAAALWLEDGRITLAPFGMPSPEFILLKADQASREDLYP